MIAPQGRGAGNGFGTPPGAPAGRGAGSAVGGPPAGPGGFGGGSGFTTPYVNALASVPVALPTVTTTSTTPVACAPAVQRTVVLFTTCTFVHATPPRLTVVPAAYPAPVSVTVVPPVGAPISGLIAERSGSYAPIAQRVVGRVTPRWSSVLTLPVPDCVQMAGSPWAMAGEPARRGMVWVGPPLSASAPR